jgi:hypothetical protein
MNFWVHKTFLENELLHKKFFENKLLHIKKS